jgi:cell division cycle 20-like protein 1, cofactor of APC complex
MNTNRPPNNTPHRDLSLRGKTARLTPQFSSIKKTTTISDPHDTTTTPRRRKAAALCHERLQFRTNSQSKRNHSFIESSPIAAPTEDGDRFIPNRAVAASSSALSSSCKGRYEFDGFKSNAHKHHNAKSLSKDKRDHFLYQSLIIDDYERISQQPKALFAFSGSRQQKRRASDPFCHDIIRPFPLIDDCYNDDDIMLSHQDKKPRRQQDIPKTAFKVLDAPDLRDDFYLHLLSWSKADVLAVALNDSVYLVSGHGRSVTRLMSLRPIGNHNPRPHYVTCVCWNEIEPHYLAVASSEGIVYVFDAVHVQCIVALKVPPVYREQAQRDIATVIAWNRSTLCAGGQQGLLYFWDLQSANRHACFKALHPHRGNVCSLAWHSDRTQFATGGNDNLVMLHDVRNPRQPLLVLRGHSAAVKALSWCPFQRDTLVTGGGSVDQTIKIWKTSAPTGPLQKSIPAGDQICTFEWNPIHHELISASGYLQSELVVWQFPQMRRITELKYHSKRILYTAMSPDGSTIVTGGGDERLALWQVNPPSPYSGRTAATRSRSLLPLLPEALNRPIR